MKKYTKLEKQLISILIGAEELIENLDPLEKNKKLIKLYKFIHGFSPFHKCFKIHWDWRQEIIELSGWKNKLL